MRKLMREGKGKVVLEGKVVVKKLAMERRNQMPKKRRRKEEKTGGEKSKACQAGLLVRRAVYV